MSGRVPEIVRWSLLSIQVCVAEDYTDDQITEFANKNHPTGIESQWKIKSDWTDGTLTRQPCESRKGCVHVVLTC